MDAVNMQSPSDQNLIETTTLNFDTLNAKGRNKSKIIRRWNTVRNCWEIGFYEHTNFVILNLSTGV